MDINPDDAGWPYAVAQNFLAAALVCGFVCDRRYVHDGPLAPEGLPVGCPCQLAVVVTPGWMAAQGPANCVPRRYATVALYLDLCMVEPGPNAVPAVTEMNTSAAGNLTALWQVMGGLQKARYNGQLGLSCGEVTPGGWEPAGQEGASGRWVTRWRVALG